MVNLLRLIPTLCDQLSASRQTDNRSDCCQTGCLCSAICENILSSKLQTETQINLLIWTYLPIWENGDRWKKKSAVTQHKTKCLFRDSDAVITSAGFSAEHSLQKQKEQSHRAL